MNGPNRSNVWIIFNMNTHPKAILHSKPVGSWSYLTLAWYTLEIIIPITINKLFIEPIVPDIYLGENYFITIGTTELKPPIATPCTNLPIINIAKAL